MIEPSPIDEDVDDTWENYRNTQVAPLAAGNEGPKADDLAPIESADCPEQHIEKMEEIPFSESPDTHPLDPILTSAEQGDTNVDDGQPGEELAAQEEAIPSGAKPENEPAPEQEHQPPTENTDANLPSNGLEATPQEERHQDRPAEDMFVIEELAPGPVEESVLVSQDAPIVVEPKDEIIDNQAEPVDAPNTDDLVDVAAGEASVPHAEALVPEVGQDAVNASAEDDAVVEQGRDMEAISELDSQSKASPQTGSKVRQELEDAIVRIETRVKAEKAARRNAEEALQRALSVSSPTPPPSQHHQQAPAPVAPADPYWHAELSAVRQELHAVHAELQRAQLAFQRANLLMDRIATAAAAGVGGGSTTPKSVSSVASCEADLDTGMAVQGQNGGTFAPYNPNMTTQTSTPMGVGNGGMHSPIMLSSRGGSPAHGVMFHRPPQPQRSPKARPGAAVQPRGAQSQRVKRTESAGDRFETRKTDAFMINHASKWNKK